MQTRRDQLQAYRYVIRRIMTSLLGTEPEHPEQPMRRLVAGTMGGIMVFFVAGGIVALVTWLSGAGQSGYAEDGAYVIEKETGARYVNVEGTLHPVENYTSARLILQADISPVRASRDDLAQEPVGQRLGIPGAPDSLPDAGDVASAPWTVCSLREGVGSEAENQVRVFIGEDRSAFEPTDVEDQAVVVETPAGDRYLIWNGKRFKTSEAALAHLGLGDPETVPVLENWLDAVPAGPDLLAMTVPNRGDTGPTIAGQALQVGDVIEDDVGNHYVVLTSGIANIKESEFLLLRGSGEQVARAYEMTSADLTAESVPRAPEQDNTSASELPDAPPELAALQDGPDTPICLWYQGADQRGDVTVTLGGKQPGARNDDTATSVVGTPDGTPAHQVSVAKGSVAVVSELPGPNVDASGFFLVTDAGVRFPVPSEDELNILGYGDVDAVPVPGSMLDLVPTGPSLNTDDADQTTQINSASGN